MLYAISSLRHHFQVEDSLINPLHGSDSPEAAEKEIQQFFPVQSTVAVIKPEVEPDIRGLYYYQSDYFCKIVFFHIILHVRGGVHTVFESKGIIVPHISKVIVDGLPFIDLYYHNNNSN